MEVHLCAACSQVVLPQYLYCPQCGEAQHRAADLEALLDECLRPLEEMERRNNRYRLGLLLSRLDRLDEGLGLILDEAAKDPGAACR